MGDELMIETRDMTKVFGSLVAVNGLNLKVRQGAIHGFVGPNGSGKTTTIKMLVGAIRCTRGEGSIKGHPVGSKQARRLVGYSPERPSPYGDMTALDYLVYMAGLSGIGSSEAETRARQVLQDVELDDSSNARAGKFSAGMKQRLGLAQALIHRPELLILDEPTANLDPGGRMWTVDKLRQLSKEEGVTIFISSHILPELEQLVDWVTMIDRGRVMSEDSVEGLRSRLSQNQYLLDTTNNEAVLAILRDKAYVHQAWVDADGVIHLSSHDVAALQREVLPAIADQGILLKSFGAEQVGLEEVYRKTVGLGEQQ